MEENSATTLEKIQEAALAEFLEKGFLGASLQRDKPFALLMSNFWLNSVGPCRLFKDRELQLLMFDKRIQYDKGGGVPFGSSYYCHRLLPKQIVFEELAVCRNDYSRMHRDVDNLNRNIAEEDTGLSLVV